MLSLGLRDLIKILRNPWLIKLVRKSNIKKMVKQQKEFVTLSRDTQAQMLIEEFKIAIRETSFVRENFPELLSVEEPEDLISIKVTRDYPDEHKFTPYRKYIFGCASTSGTTLGKPKKIFFPLTRKSMELLLKSAPTFAAIAFLGTDKLLFNRSLSVVEYGLASHTFDVLFKMVSKKSDIIVRGKERVEDVFRKIKGKYDMIAGELPSSITLLKLMKKYPEKLQKDVLFVTYGGVFSKEYLEIAHDVIKETGVNLEILNIYGSTEGHFGGAALYIDKSNPYFTEPPRVKPLYISSFHLGADLPANPFDIPEYPKNLIHRMPEGQEFCIVATVASAFAVPNYFLGDIAVIEGDSLNIIGRYLRRVKGLPVVAEAYTSPVIRAAGVVIKQTFADILANVLGTENFIAIITTGKHGAIMQVFVEGDVKISPDIDKKVAELIKKSPEHSYLIRDIEEGVLTLTFKKASGIVSYYKATGEKFRLFLAG